MDLQRIFRIAEFLQPSSAPNEPIRSVISNTSDSAVIAWHVSPGQTIKTHVHPQGQDSWTVLAGAALYEKGNGERVRVQQGDVVS
jgi:quercetin dioxygenase-like cupin family protein